MDFRFEEWEAAKLIKEAKGWTDTCPFWDEDGNAYLVHAFAYSRCGINGILHLNKMSPDGTQILDEGTLIIDGRKGHPILEGPKMYKRKEKSPVVIYYAGNMEIANQPSIGVVGSRDIDDDGIEFTQRLADCATRSGYTVVSGGARGVDSFAQFRTLENNGKVMTFLATGIQSYIIKKEIRQRIMAGQLLVMSSVHPNMRFYANNAMDRNKYIYGLSNATFVVSSDYHKGGTWAGATENINNAWVKMFVRQGENVPKGNKKLIEQKGIPVVLKDLDADLHEILVREYEHLEENIPAQQQIGLDEITMFLKNRTEEKHVSHEETTAQEVENKLVQENQEVEDRNYDLYNVIINVLLELLQHPKEKEVIRTQLNITPKQLDIWLKRAIEEGRVKKVKGKPIKYKAV